MTSITVKLTPQELELLSSLASDQLFRREFIDSRRPGLRSSPSDLSLGKKLVERMCLTADREESPVVKKKRNTCNRQEQH